MTRVADVLRTLATLAPAARSRGSYDITDSGAGLLWLGTTRSSLANTVVEATPDPAQVIAVPASAAARRLAAVDALHAEERLLREGWVFLCGTATIDGEQRRLCTPLLSHPIRLRRALGGFSVLPAGDAELTELVTDPAAGAELEGAAKFGGGALFDKTNASDALVARLPDLLGWVEDVCAAAGLPVAAVVGPTHDPLELRGSADLVAVVGAGIYATRDVNAVDMGSSLTGWVGRPGIDDTALASLYGLARSTSSPADTAAAEEVRSPLPLTDRQRAVVASSRREAMTVISGPPGCGKSHTLVATAIDAVSRGSSVLVATQSSYAAEVLADLLDRYPGPTPVLFGNAEHRAALARRLDEALQASDVAGQIRDWERVAAEAVEEVRTLEAQALTVAEREVLASDVARWEELVGPYSERYPALFSADADPEQWAAALHEIERLDDHAVGRWQRWRTRRRFRRVTGLAEPQAGLASAIRAARSRRAAALLGSSGGTRVAGLLVALARADDGLRYAMGRLLGARALTQATADRQRRGAVAALAGGLRASRSRRRELLRRLDARALVEALPLWVGTLSDIEHLLPVAAGMFDLVLLDEASQIDQRSAPPALLRARRAVVAGDPHQLRHVSFVADEAVTVAIDEQGGTDVAHLLDVRRMSTYDVATAAASVHWLGDHFRSVPHLIEFSSARFYGDRIALLTRRPQTEARDVIEVVHVGGTRDDEGVNRAEIDAVGAIVERLAAEGWTSAGVVTPFRAQADAVEQMLLARFDLEQIERLGLRVGTVHQFQGNERDCIVATTAISPDAPPASRRFLEDANLFNVMVTRARERMIVVTSVSADIAGVLGGYLAHAERGPRRPQDRPSHDAWIDTVCAGLRDSGFDVRRGYPVGRWSLDAAIALPQVPVGLDFRIAGGEPEEHIERHRQLHLAGWTFVDAYTSRFDGDAVRAVLTLAADLRQLGEAPSQPRNPF